MKKIKHSILRQAFCFTWQSVAAEFLCLFSLICLTIQILYSLHIINIVIKFIYNNFIRPPLFFKFEVVKNRQNVRPNMFSKEEEKTFMSKQITTVKNQIITGNSIAK